ncbi:MAG: DUF1934 domain-containing protein [Clostridiales bacterium]|nr:DUF1934 domain-containing protein [Clostridiales bacterium]
MTKDVIITMSGIRLDGSDEQDIELITPGQYYKKGGKDYILYEEYLKELDETAKCNIIIDEDKVNIIKYGPANVNMIFDKYKRNSSYYQTPYGSLLMGFNTTDLKIEKEEEEMRIFIKYNIDINYQHVSENDISIKIQSKHK